MHFVVNMVIDKKKKTRAIRAGDGWMHAIIMNARGAAHHVDHARNSDTKALLPARECVFDN